MESNSPNKWNLKAKRVSHTHSQEIGFKEKSEYIKEIAVYEEKDSSEDTLKYTKYQSI